MPSDVQPLKPATRELLENPKAFACSQLLALLDALGPDILDWEPESLASEIQDLTGGRAPQRNVDQVRALITAITTEAYYDEPLHFLQLTQMISGESVYYQALDLPDVEDVAWVLMEVGLSDADDRPLSARLSRGVRMAIGQLMAEEGMDQRPATLKVALFPPNEDVYSSDAPGALDDYHDNQGALSQEVQGHLLAQLADLSAELRTLDIPYATKLADRLDRQDFGFKVM